MAVLGNRATGILDMLIEGFRKSGQTMEQPNMTQVNPTPLQKAMNQPVSRLTSTGDVGTIYPDGRVAQQTSVPLLQNLSRGRVLNPVNPMQDMGQPMSVSEAMQAEQQPQATPDLMGMEKLAEDAAKVKKAIDENPQLEQDPTFMDKVKGYFGNRENMVRLAMAFNTMRLAPDQGLAAALGSELKTLQENKATTKTQRAVVNWLRANGYEQYVDVALQNPKAAVEIFKQITQKEFAPGKAPQVSGVQYDADNKAYVVVSENGQPTVKYLGTERDDPVETERMKGQWELSAKRSDEVSQKAEALETQLSQYQQAIQAIRNGAESGVIRNRLPAFDRQTAILRSIAQNLGIGVINSATFGALSEKELELALSTTMDMNLPPAELEAQIIAKMQATEKLYLEMRRKAAEMASMPYNDYIKLQNERTKENEKFRKLPEGVDKSLWYGMTMDEKRAYYEAGQ